MNCNGGSLREENIFNSRMLLEETFFDDASFTYGMYLWELGINTYDNKEQIGIRLFDRSFSAANGWTVKFQTLYNTPIVTGDILYDSNKDEYLICTEVFDIDSVHWQGKFTLCNWMLKWQNKNGEILEYPCYDMNTTQYNSGEQSNRQFTIGSSQHMITLPCDENTVVLSTPQRFYLDRNTDNPTSYIVTQNDTTSYNYGKKGLVKVTLYEYPNNSATDRPDLGICDYIDMNVGEICCHKASKAIIDYDTTIIKSGGDSQVFVGKFFDDKENEIADIVPSWTIICDFANKLQVEEFDNCLSIGIDDDSYIDEEFKLICSDGNNESTITPDTLIIKIESLL
jgi:hypothetical protein